MPGDAREISQMLAGRIRTLAPELLPNGRREGHEWRVGSLAGERGQSLAVHLSGVRAGVWCDFSSGERGDALGLVAAVLFAGDIVAALQWSRSWLGISAATQPATRRRGAPLPGPGDQPDHEAEAMRGAALRMFLAAVPAIAGTPAAAYLAGRGIDLAELGRQPRSLRFHPSLWNSESGRTWPAMVAAVTDAHGRMIAVHRTWLDRTPDGRWVKAPVRFAKKSLGSPRGGLIRLWRGASGKPLAKASADEPIVIGEGIETCLSVVIACPELRVVSAVSLWNMACVMLPDTIRAVTILKDEDGSNKQAACGFQRAVTWFQSGGRTVRVARPPVGKDFNDTLLAGEAA
jgi:hypothetical protein